MVAKKTIVISFIYYGSAEQAEAQICYDRNCKAVQRLNSKKD